MYAKINTDGSITKFNGGFITVGDFTIANPSEQMLLEAGYKPLVTEGEPIELTRGRIRAKYTELEDRIVLTHEAKGVSAEEAENE